MTVRERVALAGEILIAYGRARRSMRDTETREMVRRARQVTRRRGPRAEGATEGRSLGWAVWHTLSVLPTDNRCLVQSLTLVRLLAARDLDAKLVIGTKPGPEFSAHAWVEVDGSAVLPTEGYEDFRLLEL